jgi:hypothetical protein
MIMNPLLSRYQTTGSVAHTLLKEVRRDIYIGRKPNTIYDNAHELEIQTFALV